MLGDNKSAKLKILFVAAEVAPFAKTGGLADVAGSLPQALVMLGHDVRVVMPKYQIIKGEFATLTDFPVAIGDRRETTILRQGTVNAAGEKGDINVPVYFVDNYHYFDRDGIYGYQDEVERFAFFSKAVLEMLPHIDFQPDVIHCNDWQTGPISLLLKEQYRVKPFYNNMVTIYTIHNLQYQGNFEHYALQLLEIGEEYYTPEGIEFYNMVSFTKCGLIYADLINTVSHTYAQEIQTAEFGERLDGLLRQRSSDLYGIVNGINNQEYDPQRDKNISSNFGPQNPEGKLPNKHAIQRELGLPEKNVPVIGLISRLVDQKGLDLIAVGMDQLLTKDVQFIVLGSGESYYEQLFLETRRRFPDKLAVSIGFNARLAQLIYAGCDLFLMPSRFEPCGLGQLIALRYGTIPVVRSTGGLADTIQEFNPATLEGNGFTFKAYNQEAMLEAIDRAVKLYTCNQELWKSLTIKALSADYSWSRSAQAYVELYNLALTKSKKIAQLS
jgi:starch synthase